MQIAILSGVRAGKTLKKLISLTLSLFMVFSLCAVNTFAAEPMNSPPVAISSGTTLTYEFGETSSNYGIETLASDPDGDTLTITDVDGAGSAFIDNNSTTFSVITDSSITSGELAVIFTVSDGYETVEVTRTIMVEKATITPATLTITAPVANAGVGNASITNDTFSVNSTVWYPAGSYGTSVSTFGYNQAYDAYVTLSPATNYKFATYGLNGAASGFYTGATIASFGDTDITIKIPFEATDSAPNPSLTSTSGNYDKNAPTAVNITLDPSIYDFENITIDGNVFTYYTSENNVFTISADTLGEFSLGDTTFTFNFTDSDVTPTFTLTVTDSNRAPQAITNTAALEYTYGAPPFAQLPTVLASDADNDTLIITDISGYDPNYFSITSDSTSFTIYPVAVTTTPITVTFTIEDPRGEEVIVERDIVINPGQVFVQPVAVTAPAALGQPQNSITSGVNYDGTISWSGTPSEFAYFTEYTATIILTADEYYEFPTDVSGFYSSGAGITVTRTNATTVTITHVFPKTARQDITAAEVTIATPVAGQTMENPTVATEDSAQFSGVVSWGSRNVSGNLLYGTTYTATVTLTAATGFKFLEIPSVSEYGGANAVLVSNTTTDSTSVLVYTVSTTTAAKAIVSTTLALNDGVVIQDSKQLSTVSSLSVTPAVKYSGGITLEEAVITASYTRNGVYGGILNPDANGAFALPVGSGEYVVTFTYAGQEATDTIYLESSAELSYTVNSKPVGAALNAQNVNVSDYLTLTPNEIATDADGDTLALSSPSSSNEAVASATIYGTDLLIEAVAEGTATISVIVTDTSNESVTVEIPVTVLAAGAKIIPVSVTGGTGAGYYAVGDTVRITATVPAGYQFDTWTCDNADVTLNNASSATTTFTVPDTEFSIGISATFAEIEYTATVIGGTITGGDDTSGEYKLGNSISITAAAAETGMVFSHWTSTIPVSIADATSYSTTFTMPGGNVTVTANYKPQTYELTLVGATSSAYDSGDDVAYGASVRVSAPTTNTAGLRFTGFTLSGGATGTFTANPHTFTMPAGAVTVTANYEVAYAVTVDGRIIGYYPENANVNISRSVPSGKLFVRWNVVSGGVSLGSATTASTSFTMGTQPVVITSTLTNAPPATFAVMVTNGSADYTTAAAGATVTVTANEPTAGKVLSGFTFDKTLITVYTEDLVAGTLVFTMPASAVEVTANYTDLVITKISTQAVISGAPSGNSVYQGSTPIQLTAKIIDEDGNTVAGAVEVEINSVHQNSIGIATIYTATTGTYNVTFTYAGNTIYDGTTKTITITVTTPPSYGPSGPSGGSSTPSTPVTPPSSGESSGESSGGSSSGGASSGGASSGGASSGGASSGGASSGGASSGGSSGSGAANGGVAESFSSGNAEAALNNDGTVNAGVNPEGTLNSASTSEAVKAAAEKAAAEGSDTITVNIGEETTAISAAAIDKIIAAADEGMEVKLSQGFYDENGKQTVRMTFTLDSDMPAIHTGIKEANSRVVEQTERTTKAEVVASFETNQEKDFGTKVRYTLSAESLGLDASTFEGCEDFNGGKIIYAVIRAADGKLYQTKGVFKNGQIIFESSKAGTMMISPTSAN